MFTLVRDIISLQKDYKQKSSTKPFPKNDICNLLYNFRNKYHLNNMETFHIAKGDMSIEDIIDLMEKH